MFKSLLYTRVHASMEPQELHHAARHTMLVHAQHLKLVEFLVLSLYHDMYSVKLSGEKIRAVDHQASVKPLPLHIWDMAHTDYGFQDINKLNRVNQ